MLRSKKKKKNLISVNLYINVELFIKVGCNYPLTCVVFMYFLSALEIIPETTTVVEFWDLMFFFPI